MTTVVTTTSSGPYTAAAQTTFAVDFQSISVDEIRVTLNGADVDPAQYVFNRNADGTGSVVFTTPQTGSVEIFSDPNFQNQTDFARFGQFFPDQFNGPLDRLARVALALRAQVDNIFSDVTPGEFVAIDASGNVVGSSGTGADAGLRADLAAPTGTSLLAYTPGVGLQAMNLQTALRLGLPIMPEHFAGSKASGVVGDGTDDAPAIFAASQALCANGGGKLAFSQGRTYWVGAQVENAAGPSDIGGQVMRYTPVTPHIMEITGCSRTVIIDLNGATIKTLPGLKYGSFNADGSVFVGQATLSANAATPYFSIINIHDNTGDVFVLPGELDGNIANLTKGGGFGDTGIQYPMYGVQIGSGNRGRVRVNTKSHHQGLDGALLNADGVLGQHDDVDLSGSYHGLRQGVSVVGGYKCSLGRCGGITCRRVGKDSGSFTYSPPGAGVDVEAEGGRWVYGLEIFDPDFDDNSGPGLVSDTNSFVRKVDIYRGRIIGATSWSLWPNNPEITVHDTQIVGAIANPYTSAVECDAFKIKGGLWTDDVALSPSGNVYGRTTSAAWLVFGTNLQNVRFEELHIKFTQTGVNVQAGQVGSTIDATALQLHNCTVEKTSTGTLIFYGIYSGERTHLINSNGMPSPEADALFLFNAGVSLDSFLYENNVGGFSIALARHNASASRATGKKLYYGSKTYDPPSLATATQQSTTVTVTGVVLGDQVASLSFSLALSGTRMWAEVTAADTVTVYHRNDTGGAVDLASGTLRVTVAQS